MKILLEKMLNPFSSYRMPVIHIQNSKEDIVKMKINNLPP